MKKDNTKVEKSKVSKKEENIFEGKYVAGLGRRKTAVARVRLYTKGKGIVMINGNKIEEYLNESETVIAMQPLKLTSHLDDLNFSIVAKGGGKNGQADAIRLGITRALVLFDKELEVQLKAKGFTTRDARKKERKKPGLKKARKAPQWSKR